MAYVTVTVKVEIEFTSGVWTDVSSSSTGFVDSKSNIRWKRGIGPDRKPYASTASFSLDNSGGEFTPSNSSSAYFNKLKKNTGVRISLVYSAVTYMQFTGTVTRVRPVFVGLPAGNRVAIEAIGISAQLSKRTPYLLDVQRNIAIDDAAAAMMDAAGTTLYDFAASDFTVPFVFPRSDPLADLVALMQSDPNKVLFEAGNGKLTTVSIVGGYSSPDHTWGATITPDGALQPDLRQDSLFTRQTVAMSLLQSKPEDDDGLYKFPFVASAGFAEIVPKDDHTLIIRDTFTKPPFAVSTKFGATSFAWVDGGSELQAAIGAADTQIVRNSFATGTLNVQPRSLWRIDSEIIEVKSYQTFPQPTYSYAVYQVVRGRYGTVATSHASGAKIVSVPATLVWTIWATLNAAMNSSQTSVSVTGAPSAPPDGGYAKIGNEIMRIVSGSATNWTVERGVQNTSPEGHVFGNLVYLQEATYPVGGLGTRLHSSVDPEGLIPVETAGVAGSPVPGIVGAGWYTNGADIYVDGNQFELAITNVADDILWQTPNILGDRYVTELAITGQYLGVTEKQVRFSYSEPRPGEQYVEDGPAYSLPFGAQNVNVARSIAVGLVRAGRLPSPWVTTPPFNVALDVNVADMLAAEIGDLVHWTGTGTWREGIDEYYRVIGLSAEVDGDLIPQFTFTLVPAHLYRDAGRCYYEDFTRLTKPFSIAFMPDVPPVYREGGGGWVDPGADWGTGVQVGVAYTPPDVRRTDAFGYAFGAAAPLPILVDLGVADMAIATHAYEPTSSALTYPTAGGGGVVFRSNAAGTNYWRAFANRTTGKIHLWNTTDGAVADYTYTVAKGVQPEIEVRIQGNRIRVYVDCLPEPVIDTTSTRFNTNTYAGAQVVANSTPNMDYRFRKIYAQGL